MNLRAGVLLTCVALLTPALLADDSDSSQNRIPIKIESLFQLMNDQVVGAFCSAPEFEACFDIPQEECTRELRTVIKMCREQLEDELPVELTAEEADPILNIIYACVVPKWDEQIQDRQIESDECPNNESTKENEAET